MGNLCGKAAHDDPFSKPGRTLGSSPAPSKGTASIPSAASRKRGTSGAGAQQGQRLGGSAGSHGDREGDGGDSGARQAAAAAAEERLKAAQQSKGKLSSQLQQQKAQTRTNTLEQASADERRARDADSNAEARTWA